MPVWLVKTIWNEDETEASEQWEVSADTAYDAVREVSTRLRFQPHHVEARLWLPGAGDKPRGTELKPGQVRRIPPNTPTVD